MSRESFLYCFKGLLTLGCPFKGFSIVLSCDKLEQWFGNFSKVLNELAIIASEANKGVCLFAGGRGCNVCNGLHLLFAGWIPSAETS